MYTKKEIAACYDIAPATLSKKLKKIEYFKGKNPQELLTSAEVLIISESLGVPRNPFPFLSKNV